MRARTPDSSNTVFVDSRFCRTFTASSMVRNEQTMRRKLGNGEKELSCATDVIFSRMAVREEGWKTRRLWSSVMMRVLLGGLGFESGGRLDRSNVKEGLTLGEDDELEWECCVVFMSE